MIKFESKILLIVGIALMAVGGVTMAATKGDPLPKATNGAVQVLNSAATQIFTQSTQMPGRNAFIIYNNGPNTIWCGWRTTVTASTGFPVVAAASLSVDLVTNESGVPTLYCIASTADQVSPADTRWIQVK